MRVAVSLEPASAEAARILAEWQALWGEVAPGGGIELAAGDSLNALCDLQIRCFDQGVTVNAVFPDNS